MGVVTIGCDVGQRVDPTAIAVCEREQPGKGQPDRFIVRHLERLEIGTPYPDIAARIAAVYRGVVARMTARLSEEQTYKQAVGELRGYLRPDGVLWGEAADSVTLMVDATGVGTPVVDLIREQAGSGGCPAHGRVLHLRRPLQPPHREHARGASAKPSSSPGCNHYCSTSASGSRRRSRPAPLADELLNYEIRVTADANVTAGAFKTCTHDDLVYRSRPPVLHGRPSTRAGSHATPDILNRSEEAMNKELYDQATYPGVQVARSDVLLRRLADRAKEQALAALTAALVRPEALALADALAEPLAEATAAAAGPLAAVDAARKAFAKEQESVTARLAAFWASKRRTDPDDRERPPEQDTPKVQELRAALFAAEQAAQPYARRVAYHEEQIAGLLRAPRPDCRVLERLGVGIYEPCKPNGASS